MIEKAFVKLVCNDTHVFSNGTVLKKVFAALSDCMITFLDGSRRNNKRKKKLLKYLFAEMKNKSSVTLSITPPHFFDESVTSKGHSYAVVGCNKKHNALKL